MSQCLQPTCLHRNPENTKFCQKCGAKLLLLERYCAVRILGQGGFGRTFLAIDEGKPSRPPCVIKQLLPQAQGTSSAKKAAELFAQEAEQLEKLGKHPQIPELFAYFTQDEQQYLVQEYIAGQTLDKELEKQGQFNEQQITKLLADMFKVLRFIHSKNVIHRDIKPENIIRRRTDKTLVLVDFGAAKVDVDPTLSVTGTMIGSIGYTAPEQARGKPMFASDLYSLGLTCIHLLTNVNPTELFDDYEGEWIWRNYLGDNRVSEAMTKILNKMIERVIRKRYQSVEEIIISTQHKSIPRQSQVQQKPASSNISQPTSLPAKPASANISQPTPQTQPKLASNLISSQSASQIHQQLSSRAKSKLTSQIRQNIEVKKIQFKIVNISVSNKFFGGVKVNYPTSKGTAKSFMVNLPKGVTLDLVIIPKGRFLMGSPEDEEKREEIESPQHLVNLPSFSMGQYPVTQSQWQVIMGNNPSGFKGGTNQPVEQVSCWDAVRFCEKLSQVTGQKFRLPSEAEWEYACRAKTTTPFHFGNTITSNLANYKAEYGYGAAPTGKYQKPMTGVGLFAPNAFGLYDMHGNILEWCADNWHDSYEGAPKNGNAWLEGGDENSAPLRGGAWSHTPDKCRCASRERLERDKLIFGRSGFRVVCAVP